MKNKSNKNILRFITPVFGIIIFTVAVYVLYHELKSFNHKELIKQVKNFPLNKILLASLFSFLSYIILSGYDILAFLYIKKPFKFHKVALVSINSYIFSNNLGFSIFSGSAIRFRFYSSMGLSSIEIVKIITFTFSTFWVGLFVSGGFAFLFEPVSIPEILHLPFKTIYPLGIIMFVILGVYMFFCLFWKRTVTIKEWEFYFPDWKLVIGQIFISFFDWVFAGLVLYYLLPSSITISFPSFFCIFILAQIAGLLSNVPGGFGVFETVIIYILTFQSPADQILSSLVFYRLIYYFIPFIIGFLLFIFNEVLLNKEKTKKIFDLFKKWFPLVFPTVLSIIIFIGGIILLISGASPSVSLRMKWLDLVFPLHIMEFSHFFASLAGVGLLILSFGVQRRLDASYYLTIILLILGIVFSLLKGLDYEEAIALFIILILLLPCHKYFYRKTSLLKEKFSIKWIFFIIIVIISSI